MQRTYIKVGEQVGKDARLNAVQGLDGFWWCDQNCLQTASELFTGNEEKKTMDETDFPKSENI